MPSLSIILPAYNEERGIAGVIDAVRRAAPGAEIVVVDDGSTDRTAEEASAKGATVMRHPMNAGYGRSLKDGIRAASNDLIVIADADGSYPIERMSDLLQKVEEGYDMAVGARKGAHYRGSFLKMPARLVFKLLVEFTTGRRIPDINSGLRAFRKSAVLPLFPDLCEGFSFTTTLTLIYLLTGRFVCYIPIEYHKRVGRSKVRMVRDSLRTLQYITEVIVTYNPLKFFLLLGFVPPLSGLLGFALWGARPGFAPGIAIALITIVASCILFGMGLQMHAQRRRDSPARGTVP